MPGNVFVDTNVLVYCRDATEPKKQKLAMDWMEFLWKTKNGRLSYQVLKEFYVAVTNKLKPGINPEQARNDIRSLMAWNPVTTDANMLESAFHAQEFWKFSFWDACIVAAAIKSGCSYLLTEDLQHDQSLGNLTVISPFLVTPKDISIS